MKSKAEYVFAVDPANEKSGFAVIRIADYEPVYIGKVDNEELAEYIKTCPFKDSAVPVIEMIGHYGTGMPAGRTVFDTCIWIGRFMEIFDNNFELSSEATTLMRATIKTKICGVPKAKDANVIQALIDRFAPYTPNKGKGTKKEPGFFYGFKADIWQAYAVGVAYIDIMKEK